MVLGGGGAKWGLEKGAKESSVLASACQSEFIH